MDAIAIGCLGALANSVNFKTARRIGVQILGWCLIAFVTLFRGSAAHVGLFGTGLNVTVLAVGAAMICITSTQARPEGSRFLAPVRWFGRNSYEVYLTHMMVIFALLPLANRFDEERRWVLLSYLLIVAATGALGWCITRYYSEPMNRRLRESVQAESPSPPFDRKSH